MKLAFLLPLLLIGCAGTTANHVSTPAPVKVVKVVPKAKTVYVKCKLPPQPAPLPRPLPLENPQKLIDLLTNKLYEWAGPGKYGDKVEKACK